MQTTYYTFTAREVLASGGEAIAAPRRLVCLSSRGAGSSENTRRSGNGKIINFSDWAPRAESAVAEPAGQEETPAAPRRAGARVRRSRMQILLQAGELLATCSVIGVMALLIVRLLAG